MRLTGLRLACLLTGLRLSRLLSRLLAFLSRLPGLSFFTRLALLCAVVAAVATLGLPLAWTLPLLTLSPGFVIAIFERSRRHRPELHQIH